MKKASKFNQEMPQSQTADQPRAHITETTKTQFDEIAEQMHQRKQLFQTKCTILK